MRILLTGGAGFIGRHVIDALGAYELMVCDSFEEVVHGQRHYRPPATVTGFQNVQAEADVFVRHTQGCNILDVDGVEELLTYWRPHAIVHLAAAVSVSASRVDPARFVEQNDLGTARLWNALIRSGQAPHVVNLSSMSVYGHGYDTIGVPEERRAMPLNIYAQSKLAAEQVCLILGKQHNIDVTNLRLFNTYGPGQSLTNAETGVIAIWTAALLEKKAITVYEDGQQLRDFIYVTDVARAIELAIRLRLSGQRTYNIGTGRASSCKWVANQLAHLCQQPDPVPTGTLRSGDARHCFADIEKAKVELSFVAHTSLEDGLTETVRWAKLQAAASPADATR